MRLMDFANTILTELHTLTPAPHERDIWVTIESALTFAKLSALLQTFANREEPVSYPNLKVLCEFLSKRWYVIKNTDACYPHSPETIANRACLLLAQHLFQPLKISVYEFLMPTVTAAMNTQSLDNFNTFLLHDFLLGDDGSPIDVMKCLDTAAQTDTIILYHTAIARPLTAQEKERVIKHSVETYDFYDAIKYAVVMGIKNDLITSRKALHDAIKENNYHVTASYGKKSRERLAKGVLASLKTQEEFIGLMTTMVPPEQWQDFLSAIHNDDLSRFFLTGDSFLNCLQNSQAYTGDPVHDKAVLFCFTEIYIRFRRANKPPDLVNFFPEFSHRIISKFWKNYSQEEKISAAQVLQEFLASKRALNELDAYLTETKKNAHRGALFEMFSCLSKITRQVQLIGDKNLPRYLPQLQRV